MMSVAAFGFAGEAVEDLLHRVGTIAGTEGGRGVEGSDLTIDHNGYAVAVFCLVHIVGGYKDGDATVCRIVDKFPELPSRGWVNASRGLVKEHYAGFVEDGDGESQFLLPS